MIGKAHEFVWDVWMVCQQRLQAIGPVGFAGYTF